MHVGNVDPTQRRYGDEVVAKIAEHIYHRPVVECVRVIVTGPIHFAKKIKHFILSVCEDSNPY